MPDKDYESDRIRLQVIAEAFDRELATNHLSKRCDILHLMLMEEWQGAHGVLNIPNIFSEAYEQILEEIDNEVKRRKAVDRTK